jgi:hypothetical protein
VTSPLIASIDTEDKNEPNSTFKNLLLIWRFIGPDGGNHTTGSQKEVSPGPKWSEKEKIKISE